jgi:hypothetical protein
MKPNRISNGYVKFDPEAEQLVRDSRILIGQSWTLLQRVWRVTSIPIGPGLFSGHSFRGAEIPCDRTVTD